MDMEQKVMALAEEQKLTPFDELLHQLRNIKTDRAIVAIAGPPGGGKSTFSKKLSDALNDGNASYAAVVPMDGFHYDNCVLEEKGLINRKGSPPTFDVGGFKILLKRLKANQESEIAVPVFDRELELSRAAARIVPQSVRIIIAEGNYLLLDESPWSSLKTFFDCSVFILEDRTVLAKRLMSRWGSYGFSQADALSKVQNNDLPNVDIVNSRSTKADLYVTGPAAELSSN